MRIHQKCPREFTLRKCPLEFAHFEKKCPREFTVHEKSPSRNVKPSISSHSKSRTPPHTKLLKSLRSFVRDLGLQSCLFHKKSRVFCLFLFSSFEKFSSQWWNIYQWFMTGIKKIVSKLMHTGCPILKRGFYFIWKNGEVCSYSCHNFCFNSRNSSSNQSHNLIIQVMRRATRNS